MKLDYSYSPGETYVARKAFRFNGRDYEPGQLFDHRRMAVDHRKMRTLVQAGRNLVPKQIWDEMQEKAAKDEKRRKKQAEAANEALAAAKAKADEEAKAKADADAQAADQAEKDAIDAEAKAIADETAGDTKPEEGSEEAKTTEGDNGKAEAGTGNDAQTSGDEGANSDDEADEAGEPVKNEGADTFTIKHRGRGKYVVLNPAGDPISDEALPKDEAQALADTNNAALAAD